jgi:DMSO/TMAO reductase YedYZ molybdopterin-dependent catalytic subunit
MITRRDMLKAAGGGLALAGGASLLGRGAVATGSELGPAALLPAGAIAASEMSALEGKKPLIKKSFRPPNYETPLSYFDEAYTPNDAFFVRYHLADIPKVDAVQWRLKIGGDAAERPLALGLDELKSGFEQVEIVAVCQCSGNRRGLSDPHVPGVQWGYGAMGNARWTGVRLKELLAKAGVKKEAVEIGYQGSDGPPLDVTPKFMKSLPLSKALDENTLVAFAMNGEPLPHWNGFPARLIVPGWTATYWMKHLDRLDILSAPLKSFWLDTAYRVPLGKFPTIERFPGRDAGGTTPITEMVVNSLITNFAGGETVKAGEPLVLRGIAWDGGYGIDLVEVSTDGGQSWRDAALGADLGRFSWRQWQYGFTPERGSYAVMAKASNKAGATQLSQLIWNAAGYQNNVMQRLAIQAA